jgi:N-methylhydantoinase A
LSEFLVGVDIGGTFTDLIVVDPASGAVRVAKVPTTPGKLADGFLAALAAADCAPDRLEVIVHGTTIATNAILERKGSVAGLITTRGFRDTLEIGRRTRPSAYGLAGTFEPLISREYRYEVAERVDAEGRVVVPLDEIAVQLAAQALRARGAEAVAIHFLHSYANRDHELRAKQVVRDVWHNDFVTAGSEILAEFREFERGSTVAVNAYVQPLIDRYLRGLVGELRRRGFAGPFLVTQGNGGSMSAEVAVEHAVHTVLSGPAAGVIAAARIGQATGRSNLISIDMGGTSLDVGVVTGGAPAITTEKDLAYGIPIRVAMVDVHTIGAGGGSIARLNLASILEVGPASAGARPGPICFGRGGQLPTTTDANFVLGRLNPDQLLGVERVVSRPEVAARLAEEIGRALDLDGVGVASAIIQVANDRMASAIRLVTLERGYDPRDFALLVFGGAGPLHAVALARELGIPTVIVPPLPGITSALGCLVAEVRHDFVQTVNVRLADADPEQVEAFLSDQVGRGQALLAAEAVPVDSIVAAHEADLQFEGQSHVIRLPLARPFDRAALRAQFVETYRERFGVVLPAIPSRLVNVRTSVAGRRPVIDLASLGRPAAPAADTAAAQIGRRPVWFAGAWIDTPIYDRARLPLGASFAGPAILEQLDSTTVIDPDVRSAVDVAGNLILTVD